MRVILNIVRTGQMKKKTKQIIVLVISIVVIIGSISYALWNRTKIQDNENLVNAGCFKIDFQEEGKAIGLDNTYPITDEEGMEIDPYIITVKNICTNHARYNINLNVLNGTYMGRESVRVGVNNDSDILTNYQPNSDYDSNQYIESYTLVSDTLTGASGEDREDGGRATYSIRMWMDKDASEDDARKEFTAKISVDVVPIKVKERNE